MKNHILSNTITIFAFILILAGCASSPKNETIFDLISQGRYEEAKDRFKTKEDINAADDNGNTALHLAAQKNEADLVSFLVIKGADTDIKNNAGDIPLHTAVKNDALDCAKVLAIVHGDIFEKDAQGNMAIDIALRKGDDWYDAMITKQTGEVRDENGQSIVHHFVITRDEKAIDTCISKNIPLSVKDINGKTPLHLAFESADNSASVRIAAKLILADCELVRGEFSYFEDAVKTRNMILRFTDGQTPLHIATIDGHTGVVDYILNQKTSLRLSDILGAQDISGAAPLHEAVRYGRSDIAELLLKAGAKVDALDSLGKSPLLLIMPVSSQYQSYSTLLNHGANINQKDMYGDTVLHIATMAGAKADVLELLVSNGAMVNERNKQGVTPIEIAIEQEHQEQVDFFAKNSADIFAEDMEGNSPLSKALSSSAADMLKMLVNGENINSKDSSGNTALHIAIQKDAPIEYIKYLIETGSDVNARNKNGDSVLFMTVQKNRRDAGDLLLEKDADIFATNVQNNSPLRIALTRGGEIQDWLITSKTLNTTDGSGNTPLHYAAEWQLNNAIVSLIQKGAKVTSENANGETALFSSVKGDNPSTIQILADYGAVVDSKDNHARDNLGNTPLHACVKWNALKAAKTLISMGVDVNAQNLSGKTALSEACRSAKKEMAVLLIQNGADINASDSAGRTALMDAISSRNEQMVSLLLSYGANVQVQELYGRNAYHAAALTGNVEIINMIRNAGGNPMSRDSGGESPFSIVIRADINIVQAVLGNNTTLVDSDGNTPVHILVEKNGSKTLLTQLLNMGYPVSQRNGKGMTALNMAVEKDNKNLALVLLEYGADPYLATPQGENAITSVFRTKNFTILDTIVKYNSTKTDRQGDTILHYAARTADKDTVSHLVSMNLDRTAKNITGETPSQMAERWNRADIAVLLKETVKAN